jgi:hypothetical protein
MADRSRAGLENSVDGHGDAAEKLPSIIALIPRCASRGSRRTDVHAAFWGLIDHERGSKCTGKPTKNEVE